MGENPVAGLRSPVRKVLEGLSLSTLFRGGLAACYGHLDGFGDLSHFSVRNIDLDLHVSGHDYMPPKRWRSARCALYVVLAA